MAAQVAVAVNCLLGFTSASWSPRAEPLDHVCAALTNNMNAVHFIGHTDHPRMMSSNLQREIIRFYLDVAKR